MANISSNLINMQIFYCDLINILKIFEVMTSKQVRPYSRKAPYMTLCTLRLRLYLFALQFYCRIYVFGGYGPPLNGYLNDRGHYTRDTGPYVSKKKNKKKTSTSVECERSIVSY